MSEVQFIDGYNYANITAPEVQSEEVNKISAESILDKYKFNDVLKSELIQDLEEHIQEEVKQTTLEFVSKFFERMGKGFKTAFCVARALGFHIYLKDKGGKDEVPKRENSR